MSIRNAGLVALVVACALAQHVVAQTPPSPAVQPPPARQGPPVQGAEEDVPLVKQFDRNKDKWLDHAERALAREHLTAHPELRKPVRVVGRVTRTGAPGVRLTDRDVQRYPDSVSLYDRSALRTFFLDFEHPDWEQELEAFWHTDVEIAATLRVDGKTYRDVGVSFRGNNSYTGVPAGLKRPLSLTIDFVHDQNLLGHTSLNLLNSFTDPTFLRSSLYLDVTNDYIPAPEANFVRVVINGESWGIYVNQQTFSKEFVKQRFHTSGGTRWKSPNNSVGGGLSYLGDSIAPYRKWYEMKGKDDTVAWRRLVDVTRILSQTPPERLEAALAPVMDVDAVLRFLAIDVALVNGDGYWKDGSDFNVYLRPDGRLTLLPHDANEGFRSSARGGGVPGATPDPLVNMADTNKALRHRLLAVPALRTRYLAYVRDIAEKWLDWQRLGPVVERYRALIAEDVARDTRKLFATEDFANGIFGAPEAAAPSPATLKGFAELRRAALLLHPEIMKARGK
jgi:hypothetical protein